MNQTAETMKKERDIVIARLETTKPELHFTDGDNLVSYSRNEIISHIEKDDEVGKEFVRTELEFLRALKNGVLINKMITD